MIVSQPTRRCGGKRAHFVLRGWQTGAGMNLSGIPSDSLLGRAARLPLRVIPKGARLPILQGRLRGKRWIVGSGTHGCWLGSYEYEKRRLFERTVTEGSTVFDIGANVGFYTLLAFVLVGQTGGVVAFEPVPRNLEYEHLRLNRVGNVRVIEAAVAEQEGAARFDPGPHSSMGHLSPRGVLGVRTIGLDETIVTGGLPVPDYLKIDVEGAEAMVLRGARGVLAEHRPTIFLSTHGPEVHRECVDLLSSIGYRLTAIGCPDVDACDEILATPAPAEGKE
jgi:FkbM family methyltransferase